MIPASPFRTAWRPQRSAANPVSLPFRVSAPTIRAEMRSIRNISRKEPSRQKCATPMCSLPYAASPDFFLVLTVQKTSRVRIALPAGEEGETDDSKYAMPTGHCPGHTSVTIDPSYLGPDEDDSDSSSEPGVSSRSWTGRRQHQAIFCCIQWARTRLTVCSDSSYTKTLKHLLQRFCVLHILFFAFSYNMVPMLYPISVTTSGVIIIMRIPYL